MDAKEVEALIEKATLLEEKCENCRGTGSAFNDTCLICGGTGEVLTDFGERILEFMRDRAKI